MANKEKVNTYNIADEFNIDTTINGEHKHYITNRVLAQIQWYDKKSIECQKLYKRLSCATIILTSIIPIITLFSDNIIIKLLIAVISATASVISYIITINTYRELWIRYRSNCELLKSELHKFLNKIGDYKTQDIYERFELFCYNCENCFVEEFISWQTFQDKDKAHSLTGS